MASISISIHINGWRLVSEPTRLSFTPKGDPFITGVTVCRSVTRGDLLQFSCKEPFIYDVRKQYLRIFLTNPHMSAKRVLFSQIWGISWHPPTWTSYLDDPNVTPPAHRRLECLDTGSFQREVKVKVGSGSKDRRSVTPIKSGDGFRALPPAFSPFTFMCDVLFSIHRSTGDVPLSVMLSDHSVVICRLQLALRIYFWPIAQPASISAMKSDHYRGRRIFAR